jgi:hypothetical protein
MTCPDPGVTEAEFHRRKDLKEGVNGQDRFSANFENTERTQVLAPRGDKRGRPMPRDAKFRQANNHGEWGYDQYVERIEYGMDGPDSTEVMGGLGLPKRPDLMSNANPQLGSNRSGFDSVEDYPQDQGLGGKTP